MIVSSSNSDDGAHQSTVKTTFRQGTPAFIMQLGKIRASAEQIVLEAQPAKILYSIKASSQIRCLETVTQIVEGIAVSSQFEARLASTSCCRDKVHFCGLAAYPHELQSLVEHCGVFTLNSLAPSKLRESGRRWGVRTNPGLSVADDLRYDPCRRNSKLGVSLDRIFRAWSEGSLYGISGIHFHTACCCSSWEPLLRTVKLIEEQLAPMMYELEWMNLGGGYQWDEVTDFGPLQEAVDLLVNSYGLEVFLEPGSGIVNSAGSLISSVVDMFESDGKAVAILDTSVNHLPEVFEYQYEPDVAEHVDGAPHKYILAGCSCLAGDLFGEYTFEEPLDIGSRITFENVGAYSLVKANMFNGINLPSIYILQEDGRLELIREFTYEDYLARCGGESHAVMPAGI